MIRQNSFSSSSGGTKLVIYLENKNVTPLPLVPAGGDGSKAQDESGFLGQLGGDDEADKQDIQQKTTTPEVLVTSIYTSYRHLCCSIWKNSNLQIINF